MLAKTFRLAHGHAEHGHAVKAANPLSTIERVAAYAVLQDVKCPIHPHEEPEFRKRPFGMRAYSSKNLDLYAPYQLGILPFRHATFLPETSWFGFGHSGYLKKFQGGRGKPKMILRCNFWGVLGVVLSLFVYGFRMTKNGWIWMNRNATYGIPDV